MALCNALYNNNIIFHMTQTQDIHCQDTEAVPSSDASESLTGAVSATSRLTETPDPDISSNVLSCMIKSLFCHAKHNIVTLHFTEEF